MPLLDFVSIRTLQLKASPFSDIEFNIYHIVSINLLSEMFCSALHLLYITDCLLWNGTFSSVMRAKIEMK